MSNSFQYRDRYMTKFAESLPEFEMPAKLAGMSAQEVYAYCRQRAEVIVYSASQKADSLQAYIDQIIEG